MQDLKAAFPQSLETPCSMEEILGCCKLPFSPASAPLWVEWLLPVYSCHMSDVFFFPVYSILLNFLMWTPAKGLPKTNQIPSTPYNTFLDQLHVGLFCLLSPLGFPRYHSHCIFFKSLSLLYRPTHNSSPQKRMPQ